MTGWEGGDWPGSEGWEHDGADGAAEQDGAGLGFGMDDHSDPGGHGAPGDHLPDPADAGESGSSDPEEPFGFGADAEDDHGHAAPPLHLPPPDAHDDTDAAAGWSAFDGSDGDVDGTDLAGIGTEPQEAEADPFPPVLDVDVAPTDGSAWADPGLLGAEPGSDDGYAPPADPPQALLADLQYADGGDGPGEWSTLTGSDDPAVRALAQFWS